MSRAEIDRLGDRLRKAPPTDDDLRLLDSYRRSFTPAYEAVFAALDSAGLHPSGRPAKSTSSITEKLRREHVRLSQMQDVAGCRVVVPSLAGQDLAVSKVVGIASGATIFDRRTQPSHGYRAVHIVLLINGKPVEVQVRTVGQHRWAEVSEKLDDKVSPGIKYGQGPEALLKLLNDFSKSVADTEENEEGASKNLRDVRSLEGRAPDDPTIRALRLEVEQAAEEQQGLKARVLAMLDSFESWFDSEGGLDDFLD